MICALTVMYSCVHSSNTTILVFSLVIKDFFYTAAVNKEYNSAQTWNTIPSLSLEWHSDFTVTERTHSVAVREMVSSCLQMEVSVTGTVGTLAQQQCAAALSSAKDASTEGGLGSEAFFSLLLFFYCLRFLFWKPLRSKFPHSERGDEKAQPFETCPSTNVKKRRNDSYL